LSRDRDGIPRVGLNERDRRALAWFELELHAAQSQQQGPVEKAKRSTSSANATSASIHEFVMPVSGSHEQLELSLDHERQA